MVMEYRTGEREDPLECLAHAHAPGPATPAPSEVSAKIDVVLLAQFISRPAPHIGQEVVVFQEDLTRTGDHSTNARKRGKAEPFWQCQPVLQLRRGHIAVEVFAGRVPSQLVFRAINAIPVERRLPGSGTGKEIECKDLILAQTLVFVKGESVRLKRKFSTQGLHEEVGGEFQLFASDRVELIGTCVPDQPQTQGPHGRVDAEAGRRRGNITVVWGHRNKRLPGPKSRPNKNFPPKPAQNFSTENVAGLRQRKPKPFGDITAVQVIVHVTVSIDGCDLVGVLLHIQVCAQAETAAPVVRNKTSRAY